MTEETIGNPIPPNKMTALRNVEAFVSVLASHPKFLEIVGSVAEALGTDSDALGYTHRFEIEHTGSGQVVPVEISVFVGEPNETEPDVYIEADE